MSPKMIGADDRWTTSSLSVLLSCRAWLYESRTNLESSAKVVPSGCATMSPRWCGSQSNPPVLFFCHRRPLIVCYLTHHWIYWWFTCSSDHCSAGNKHIRLSPTPIQPFHLSAMLANPRTTTTHRCIAHPYPPPSLSSVSKYVLMNDLIIDMQINDVLVNMYLMSVP